MGQGIRKAVFPAAGLGTRFLPATKASPKEMLPIVDKPLIQYGVEEAVECGIDQFIIITGKNKRAIEDHFDTAAELEEKLRNSGKDAMLDEITRLNTIDFAYIRQRVALGLGHAIFCAEPFVGQEPFAVILSDDVIDPDFKVLKEMIELYEKVKSPVVAIQEVPRAETKRYGIIDGEIENGAIRIKGMVEKPDPNNAPSNLAIIGRYILTPDIFDVLKKQEPGKGGEIQLTDALISLMSQRPIYGYKIKGGRYDAGDKLGYLMATVDFALKNSELSDPFRKFLDKRICG
ncbi:MAG: UTP--glucose-1-phosphate uridylyltransferase GalU [Nitrospirae bacterium]|nr:UTP--glucose-1-phosphate uridylyltransferase GalU [Nitrospirota bacterium]